MNINIFIYIASTTTSTLKKVLYNKDRYITLALPGLLGGGTLVTLCNTKKNKPRYFTDNSIEVNN